MENPDLGPTVYDCDKANQALDELGYTRGSDGIRMVPATTGPNAQPAHPMKYEILQTSGLDYNGERAFDIVKEGFAKLGVDVSLNIAGDATAAYAAETGDTCDGTKNPPVGYDGFDMAMWGWSGYIDPDFQLSVVTRAQWCSWSDTGWINADYDELYAKQGVAIDRDQRQQIVYQMQQIVYDNFLYTQLVNEEYIDANAKTWTNFKTLLEGYSKEYYTAPYQRELTRNRTVALWWRDARAVSRWNGAGRAVVAAASAGGGPRRGARPHGRPRAGRGARRRAPARRARRAAGGRRPGRALAARRDRRHVRRRGDGAKARQLGELAAASDAARVVAVSSMDVYRHCADAGVDENPPAELARDPLPLAEDSPRRDGPSPGSGAST